MTNDEKWVAVLMQFQNYERSDREIARAAKVSPTFVAKVRKQLEKDGLQVVEKRLGRDGKRRKRPE